MSVSLAGGSSPQAVLLRLEEMVALASGDVKAQQLLDNVVDAAITYVGCIYKLECLRRTLPSFTDDRDVIQEQFESYDNRRTMAHNALISNLEACTRYFRNTFGDDVPQGGLLTTTPEAIRASRRNAIRDWAIDFAASVIDAGR